jgi:predicted RNA polymerase sigma factor
VAVAEADGPQARLDPVDRIPLEVPLPPPTRELLRRLRRTDGASDVLRRALSIVQDDAERRLLDTGSSVTVALLTP